MVVVRAPGTLVDDLTDWRMIGWIHHDERMSGWIHHGGSDESDERYHRAGGRRANHPPLLAGSNFAGKSDVDVLTQLSR